VLTGGRRLLSGLFMLVFRVGKCDVEGRWFAKSLNTCIPPR
jgi:hypothetical protein